jgi:hypothetical protein
MAFTAGVTVFRMRHTCDTAISGSRPSGNWKYAPDVTGI